ncbi:eIF-2-alpha kinase activator GCN1-like isoform X2 [Varroa jacobsoni]|uniref:eIF-2-alpha kinase activator GCN1-like isoform X2 n=1 Tax=Varroa jacobsoni TaxID=62625 RepID=UPI000BF4C8F0|nr:eIF-2-alpha kinase activator GCN1-like isoform X2 [Varroa jacobsoni]
MLIEENMGGDHSGMDAMFSEWIRLAGSSSERQRKEALISLRDFFTKHGKLIEESKLVLFGLFVKGALFTYFDGGSRDRLIDTVGVCARETDKGATYIGQALAATGIGKSQCHVAPKFAKIGVFAVRLTIVTLEAIGEDHEAAEPLMKCLIQLLAWVCKAGNAKLTTVAFRTFSHYMSQVSVESFAANLSKCEADLCAEEKMIILEFIFRFLETKSSKTSTLMDTLKPQTFETLTTLLTAKTGILSWVSSNWAHVLKIYSLEDFDKIVMPPLQRQMLRSPEVIIATLADIFSGLALDLSSSAEKLVKMCGPSVIANDEGIQRAGRAAILALAKLCPQQHAAKTLLTYQLGVLAGSEGKLASTSQKLSIIATIRETKTAYANDTSLSSELLSCILRGMAPLLKSEVSEPVILEMLQTIAEWCSSVPLIPKELISIIEIGLRLKTSSTSIQVAYLNCFLSGLTDASPSSIQQPSFIKTLEDVLRTSQGKSAVVAIYPYYIATACVLYKLASKLKPSDELAKLLSQTTEGAEALPYLADKFIFSTVSGNPLLEHMALELVEMLLRDGCPFGACCPVLLRTLTSSNRNVRTNAIQVIKRICSPQGEHKSGGIMLALYLLDHIDVVASEVTAPQAIIAIAVNEAYDRMQSLLIAEEAILAAHTVKTPVWVKILEQQKISLENINVDKLLARLMKSDEIIDERAHKCIASLASFYPEVIFSRVAHYFEDHLKDPALLSVSKLEVQIFHSPKGEVFDKTVIGQSLEVPEKNVKRESKAYTYEEQLFELELKKISEQKKGIQLTPKQKEALVLQLEKETTIRQHLQLLHVKVVNSKQLMLTLLNSTDLPTHLVFVHLSPYMKHIVRRLLAMLGSYLAANHMKDLLYEMIIITAPTKRIGLSAFYALLRARDESRAAIDNEWRQEPLVDALHRTIRELHTYIVRQQGSQEYHEIVANEFTVMRAKLNSLFFNLVFPLLALILQRELGSETSIRCIQLAQAYYVKNFVDDDESMVLCNPGHLCSADVLYTLLVVGQNTALRADVQIALIEICQSLSVLKAEPDVIDGILELLYCPNGFVRTMCFRTLQELFARNQTLAESLIAAITKSTWMFKCDPEETVRSAAEQLWLQLNLQASPEFFDVLVEGALKPQAHARQAAGQALMTLSAMHPNKIGEIVSVLRDRYATLIADSEPQKDNFGRIVDLHWVDTWYSRWGVAHALRSMAGSMNQTVVIDVVSFLIPTGLSDPHSKVNIEMLDAGLAIVDAAGKESVSPLLKLIDDYLKRAEQTPTGDRVRQSVVILMGALARHLDKNDNRVKPIVRRLLELLSVPSQSVQEAISACLPPLAPAVKGEAPGIVNNLMAVLLNSENYGERRGAAYGLAGLVKGLGILSLKQLDIMPRLTDAIQDKKNVRKKEGALFAFEILCNVLGKLFEPYIVHILSHLLTCFGDSNQYVREATEATAKAMMRHLTGHGVKLTLPILLGALEDDSWRTKCGAVELLGSMAYCAPKQLSTCLPTVVPKLIQVLSDSHVKVQQAGAQALSQVGQVIKNPEIQEIVGVLLEALQNPSDKTQSSLATLLETRFVHFIDAPSLALIMPVIQRALQDRSTETRKMAAQIIGNMYSLTDQKDLMPYYPSILPGLKTCLLDPVPEVRTVSARALGTIVKGTGEQCLDNLVPWLMETLTSEASPVDRSGAAQGLAEVMGGMGVHKLHVVMPELIESAERTDLEPHFRDGYLMMFIYLPLVFHKGFTSYIAQIINPILQGLADETEFVRDTALLAGQRIVAMYAETAIQLLLPELEKGLFDDNWRIRFSSAQLIGDLLYKISGVSGKMTTETADEDDNFGTEQSHTAISGALGVERMNRLFSGLYMGRMDTSLMVRQASIHVWKVVVSNTPRTLREILPTMFGLLLGFLASNSHDKQQIAAKTLGDLVRKLGERVLPEIMPILERGLDSKDADQRQGVCIGLSEIVACTPRQMVLHFLDNLVPTVRKALCDPLKEVRCAAAKTFDSLHTAVGARALEEIITPLFDNLESEDRQLAEDTLDGLRQVMMLRSKFVLPHLVPQLTRPPVNTKALSYICSVAQGEALVQHFARILDALLVSFSQALDTPQEVDELGYCRAVVLATQEPECIQVIVDTLLSASRTSNLRMKRACVAILCAFCTNTKSSLETHFASLMRDLIRLYLETDLHILALAAEALLALVKQLRPGEDGDYRVMEIRGAVRSAAQSLKKDSPYSNRLDGPLLPGLCTAKGAEPLISIYKDVLLNCSPELKEVAAVGLGEMIALTDPPCLSHRFVSNFTGPLIRVLGDRYAPSLKTAVLHTLTLLLKRVSAQLKPFLPQLYSTFTRALADAHRGVRLHGAVVLGCLANIYPKPAAIVQELHNQVKTVDDPSFRETLLFALRCVLERLPSATTTTTQLTDVQRRSLVQSLAAYGTSAEDSCRRQAAACLGALCNALPSEELTTILSQYIFESQPGSEWTVTHFRAVSLQVALRLAPETIVPKHLRDLETCLLSLLASHKGAVAETALRATGFLLLHCAKEGHEIPVALLTTFAKTMNKPSTELKQLLGEVVHFVCVHCDLPVSCARILTPHLVNGTKEKNTVVRANAEFALIAMLKMTGSPADEKSELMCALEKVLDGGARETLIDVYNKTLVRTAQKIQMQHGSVCAGAQPDHIDDTMLM